MKCGKTVLTCLLPLLVVSGAVPLHAALPAGARPRDFVVDLRATVSDTPPHIALSWTQRMQSNISGQRMSRRLKGETAWVQLATLTTTQTNYVDDTAEPGVEYEYWMRRTFTDIGSAPIGSSPSTALGYLSAGVKVPEVHSRGTLLLLVDDTMTVPLAPEIAQLKDDLVADGWTVQQIDAPRTGTPVSTKALVKAAYDADPANVKMLYILGHVPVPFSGNLYPPDGHTDQSGAWPADGYYGELTSTWTDTTVNNATSIIPETRNIPGDGKFDQSTFPSLVELQVGRVDMYGLTKAPSVVVTETALLRRYLRKAHDFRYKQGAYANIRRRTLMLDGMGILSGYEPITINFWAPAFSSVPEPPAEPVIDEAVPGTWFNYAGTNSYLMGEGAGGGVYEGDSGVGSSTEFGRKASRVVFMCEMASGFGRWDGYNNLMRSIIAGNAEGTSLALTCFWVGRPNYFLHHLGMGETIGFGVRTSQNSSLSGGGGYTPTGFFPGYVHVGLLGDPALRLHIVEPPRGFAGTSANGLVTLGWAESTEPRWQGDYVYRADTRDGPFALLTPAPVTTNTFTDATAIPGQTYAYMVRTLKLESVPGGSYFNLSQGSLATIEVKAGETAAPANPSDLSVTPPGVLTWRDNAGDETGFRIERRTNAGGTYVPIATLAANTTSYTDTNQFTHGNVYYYRVMATGAAGDSDASNEASFDAVAGFFDVGSPSLKVSRTAGTAEIAVERFGGSVGEVTLNYVAQNASAVAGTHFTSPSGTLTWADGEKGIKTISVPLINTGAPQQARQFRISLSSATGGAGIGQYSSIAVLIEDPTATLPSPWNQDVGGNVNDSSPAVEAEGALGSASMGGSGFRWSDALESGHFIYQSRTGDVVMTAFIPTPEMAQADAFFAVMARESVMGGSMMAATVVSGSANIGSQFIYRQMPWAASVLTGKDITQSTPRWLRLTRTGNTFTSETSADGATWTLRGLASVPLPVNALWGLFHISQVKNSSSGYGDYQLASFQNVSFGSVPATTTPSHFALASPHSTSVKLTWTASAFAAGYRLERRDETSAFVLLADLPSGATNSFTDATVTGDNAYQYRIRAYNAAGDSAWASAGVGTVAANITTNNIPAEADAAVYYASPDTPFGGGRLLAVAGSNLEADGLTNVAKSWLRFNLSGLPPLATARLKLAVVASRDIDYTEPFYKYFYGELYQLSEASDTWDESVICWNNAPQNDTAGKGTLSPVSYLGELYLEASPVTGAVLTLGTAVSTINANKGANGKISLALVSYESYDASNVGAVDFASREHASQPGPTLEVTYLNPFLRPGFLAVTPGAGSSLDLAWMDTSTNEVGFQIERRVANGEWALLQNVPSNTTSFTDTTTLPGVIYEYRLRARGDIGSSSWATAVSVQHTGAAVVNNPVWSSDSVVFNQADTAFGSGFVPVGFIYSPALTFVTGQTLSTLRSNFSGWVGMKITVGANPVTIRELGRWVVPGNTGTHTVKIVEAATGTDVASVSVATLGVPSGQFEYVSLATAVTFAANTSYYLLSEEMAGGDQWYDFRASAVGTPTGYQSWLLANGLPMDGSGGGSAAATPAGDSLPNLIKYALGLSPHTEGGAGRLAYGQVFDTGSDYLSFTYTRPEPAPGGITYSVESSSDLASEVWTTAGLTEISNNVTAGLRSISVRDASPLTGGSKRFMGLRITLP